MPVYFDDFPSIPLNLNDVIYLKWSIHYNEHTADQIT